MQTRFKSLRSSQKKRWSISKSAFLWIALLFATQLAAQQTVSGTVTDDQGMPLPGVSVIAKGTTVGVTTDFDGNYSIMAPQGVNTLVFSYIGFSALEIPTDGSVGFNVQLQPDVTSLDEVVITGYTTQLKRNVTGSIVSVDTEELQQVNAASVAQQLQGQAAGVQVLNENTPGGGVSVRVRGFGTINNNDPLFIVDGIKVRGNLNNINPNDIESIQVLRDASSAAIYGIEGANGVVVITTKKGSREKTELSLNIYNGVQFADQTFDLANSQEWGEILWQQLNNAGQVNPGNGFPEHPQYGNGANPVVPDFILPAGAFEGQPNTTLADYDPETNRVTRANSQGTDWYDEILQEARIENYQLTASGGGKSGIYLLSGNYFKQEGIVRQTGFERYTARANTQFDIGDNIRLGQTLQLAFQRVRGDFEDQDEANAIAGAFRSHPIIPVRDLAGNFAGTLGGGIGNFDTPVAILERDKNNGPRNTSIIGSFFGEIDFMKNITFRSNFGFNLGYSRQSIFSPRRPENVEQQDSENTLEERRDDFSEWIWTNSIKYENSFGDHDVKATIFMEGNRQESDNVTAVAAGFQFEDRDFLVLGNAANILENSSTRAFTNRFSIFGQVSYGFKDRYLLEGTYRRDESSLFAPGARVGNFGSVSGGWIISEENFFGDIGALNFLKLFGGYGELGNDKVPFSNQFTSFESSARFSGFDINGTNNSVQLGFRPDRIGNTETTWETTKTTNVGVAFGLFQNKLSGSFEWYQRDTEDMLFDRALPPVLDSGSLLRAPFVNIGDMRNTGFDIQLSFNDSFWGGDFTYGITANLSRYKNEVIRLRGGEDDFFGGDAERSVVYTRTEVGQPISSFFGYIVDGIFQNQAEVDAHPEFAENPSYNAPGTYRFRDVNNDGIVNDEDRTFIGSPHPDFTYGLNLSLGYKNWDLSAFMNGVQGNEVINQTRRFTEFSLFAGGRARRLLTDTWRPDNPNATLPILDFSDNTSGATASSAFVEDGSYFRLRNIEIGYTLPQQTLESIGLTKLRIYLQGQNLFTITDYSGLDPELTSSRRLDESPDRNFGVDTGSYPIARSVILGLNVSL